MSILLIILVAGCASISLVQAQKFKLPPANAKFDYQLGGAYTPPKGVTIVGRDRLAKISGVGYDICYINGFQTQPEDSKKFFKDHPDLLLLKANGKPLADPDWPDEYIYDTSTAAKRASLVKIVKPWIEGCKKAGFSAVEMDNLDSFTRFEGKLTADNNIALAKEYATIAHDQGLAIAQKNTVEYSKQIKAVGYDFAVTESCYKYKECRDYMTNYTVVLDIEYTNEIGKNAFPAACKSANHPAAMIMRDRELTTPNDSSYYYKSC